MKPLAWNHNERGVYECPKGPPPPYPTSKSIPDESTGASRALVHPAPPHTQYATGSKPVTTAFQAFNQMIGTVQPMAQAQAYNSLQVHSSNEASSQTLNTLIYKPALQPICQTIPAPGRKHVVLQNKGSTNTNKAVQQVALNGVVWMTTTGQPVQTANNVHRVHSARIMQSCNPVVVYQNENAGYSSKTLISVVPTNGNPSQISVAQGQLNVCDSQKNGSSALNLTANDFVTCNDQIQFQGALRKGNVFQDHSKAPSTIAGTIPAQVFYRGWPALTNCVFIPAHAHGTRGRGDFSEQTGSSVSLSLQPNGQHNSTNPCFSPANSNGQKRMVLARVTPMSHDWINLQQNPNAFPTTDINTLKNFPVESAQLHHKLGCAQQGKTLSNATSTSEKSVEKKNTTIPPQLSTARISEPIAPIVPPLQPSLHVQQNAQNIHFIYTAATVNKHCTVTSSMSSSDLKAHHNANGSGNYISTSNASSKDPVASHLSPLSVEHGNLVLSSSSSDLVTQQTVTVSSVGAGSLCNRGDHQNVLPSSDLLQSMNTLPSTLRLASKDKCKNLVSVSSGSIPPPLEFDNENSKSSPVRFSAGDDCGKQGTADLLRVIPHSVVVHNCQNTESSTVFTPSSILTHETDIPVKLTDGQIETCNDVVETLTSMSEMSRYSAASDANHCKEILGHGSPTVDECSDQQKDRTNPLPEFNQKFPLGVVSSSSSELNGKKRNLMLDTELLSQNCSAHNDPTFCDVQENLAVINCPPPKRFLASALEDASQDARGCKNAVLCPDKEAINALELLHSEATNVDQADVGVKPEICITGVFSLGDNTELWRSGQASSFIDLVTDSNIIAIDEMNNSSASKGSVTLESSLNDKSQAEECNTDVMEENGQMVCVPPSNLENGQCYSIMESPGMIPRQPVLKSSFDKNISQLFCNSNNPADSLIDLTEDEDYSADSALPFTLEEDKAKLISDESFFPSEVNSQFPLLTFDKETLDLDWLLHSVEKAIETLLNFWNPDLPPCARGNTGMLACKQNNLQGETCQSKLPNTEETTLSVCGAAEPDKIDKADHLKDSDCDISPDIKVLGHVEILNLLAEISKSNSNEGLPVEGADSEPFTHSIVSVIEETPQRKSSQNANSDESNESSAKVMEIKERRYGGEQNRAPLQGLGNKNSTTKKGKQQEKKEYCCINAWLVASGVLGIYCNCKLSQGNKAESLKDLPAAVHKTQSSSETSNQNCIVNQKEMEPTLNSVAFVTSENVSEISEKRNSSPITTPDYNQEKVMGEVPQKVCSVDAMQLSSEVRARAIEENEMGNLCKPGNTNLNGFNASEESDRLTGIVAPEGELDQKKIQESKEISLDAVEIGPDKEDCIVVLEKELNEDKTKNARRDPSPNVLSEKASHQTDALQFKQHIVKLGFKVVKRKTDRSNCWSPTKKRKIGVQGKKSGRSHGPQKNNHSSWKKTKCDTEDAKVLPNYNCRIMIRDKTYSSSGERAVLVSLLPISG